LKSIDESAEDVTYGEILCSQAWIVPKLQPHLIIYNAFMFQKLETVAYNPPSRGEHVRVVHARRLI